VFFKGGYPGLKISLLKGLGIRGYRLIPAKSLILRLGISKISLLKELRRYTHAGSVASLAVPDEQEESPAECQASLVY